MNTTRDFLALRAAAICDVHTPRLKPGCMLVHYLGGVMDTLDGSHGTHLTYIPIAYNDDSRVCDGASSFDRCEGEWCSVRIRFVANNSMQRTALRAAADAGRFPT